MEFAVAAMSHAPVLGRVDPGGSTYQEILEAIERIKEFVADFGPEVVICFGPDHFNGMLYEMMPSFCIGAQAEGVGDWGTSEGPLPVDSGTARFLHAEVLQQGIDVPRSERLRIDHGLLQSLELLFGPHLTQVFVPVVVNCIGRPLGPMQRIRLFGQAVGAAALKLDKRVLFMGSGGLSHDPPIADFETADPALRERLTSAVITAELRAQREATILTAARRQARGEGDFKSVNEAWDREILRVLQSNELSQADAWENDWMTEQGGSGAHEVRCWLAAFAALSACGAYETVEENYWPSEPWGAGFGMVTARSVA